MSRNEKAAGGWFRHLGPGLITGAADDDPSGVAAYAQAGAAFGCGLLWVVLLTTPLMLAVQLVAARIGRVTEAGVVANFRLYAWNFNVALKPFGNRPLEDSAPNFFLCRAQSSLDAPACGD